MCVILFVNEYVHSTWDYIVFVHAFFPADFFL